MQIIRLAWGRVVFVFCLATVAVSAETNQVLPKVEQLFQETRPLVIAHRGYSAFAPENTMTAFDLAIQAGADLVELDYHHSKDGLPIVIHDAELDRTTDADELWGGKKIRVDTKAAGELTALEAGLWFNPPVKGLKLPSLEEAVLFIQKGGATLIERKAGDAKTCVELMRKHNLTNQAMVQAFDWKYLEDFHQHEPKQILGALGPPSKIGDKTLTPEEKALSPAWIDQVKKTGAKAVVWNALVSAEAIQDAHTKGLKVWVYTIDDAKKAEALLAMGVDAIITNNPSIIWRVIALRKK